MIRGFMALFVVMAIGVLIYHIKTAPPPNLLKESTKLTYWRWEQHGLSSGGINTEDGAIRCDILKDDGGKGNLSFFQQAAKIEPGHKYRVRFTGKTDKERTISVRGSAGDFHAQVFIGKPWHKYQYTFQADGERPGETTNIPIFELGGTGLGSVWLKDIAVEALD